MVYIPENINWYLAEMIEEIKIEGDHENILNLNFVLIKANSPDEAYNRAIEMGGKSVISYMNLDNKEVSVRFRGLRGLYAVCEELGDGAEILYEERRGVPEEDIVKMVKGKEALAVFSPTWDDK